MPNPIQLVTNAQRSIVKTQLNNAKVKQAVTQIFQEKGPDLSSLGFEIQLKNRLPKKVLERAGQQFHLLGSGDPLQEYQGKATMYYAKQAIMTIPKTVGEITQRVLNK